MALEFELAGSQIDGARDYQEDAFLITHLTDANGKPSALVIIADGMGGHAAGNVASNMAVQAFNKHVSANYPADDIPSILEQAVVKANSSIKETVAETPALSGMGCTMVAAILEEGKMWWASVGDSYCYLIRERELIKKNADHSYGGFLDRMEAEGTPVEPEPGLSRNMLMSAVTGDDINEIDVPSTPLELQAGDKVLLCSDGLDTLSAGKIIQYSDWSESPKECADALMQAVEDADMPRQDNTTVVVVTVKDSDDVAVAEEPVTEDLESTAEIALDDVAEAEAKTEDVAPPVEEAPVQQEEMTASDEPKSKTGLYIGIAAAVIIIIAAGIFFTSGGEPTQQTEPLLAETEIETVEEAVEVIEEEVAEVVEEKEAAPVVAVTETKPETIETKATSGKTLQDALKSGGNAPIMVVIPAGKFQMGSTVPVPKIQMNGLAMTCQLRSLLLASMK